jgi:hypothetical protein
MRKKTYQRPKRRRLTSLGPFSSFATSPPPPPLPVSPESSPRRSFSRCVVVPFGLVVAFSRCVLDTRSHPTSSCSWRWFSMVGGAVSVVVVASLEARKKYKKTTIKMNQLKLITKEQKKNFPGPNDAIVIWARFHWWFAWMQP